MAKHVFSSSSKMMSLQAVLLLSVVAVSVAWEPDCTNCPYQNGIGFAKGQLCQSYYMCIKTPYFKELYDKPDVSQDKLYTWQVFCCAAGLSWDEEHLTCKRNPKCTDPRTNCPNATTTTDTPCPMKEDPDDKTKYFTSTHEQMMCPYGSVWNQEDCTCVFKGPYSRPCPKVLHYTFNKTFDSDSCYNFAVGEPYGEPSVADDMLCLNGTGEFVSIPFLNNWFGWNPVGNSFTICFWIRAGGAQTSGVFSTNCDEGRDTLIDVWLNEGYLNFNLCGEDFISGGEKIAAEYWSKICIVYSNGHYLVYANGKEVNKAWVDCSPINSHSDATLGYVRGKDTMKGYFDDFCFWTVALTPEEVKDCYDKGPSSAGQVGPMNAPTDPS